MELFIHQAIVVKQLKDIRVPYLMKIFGGQHPIIQIGCALVLFDQIEETVFDVLVRSGAVEESSLMLGHYLLAVDVLEIEAVQIWEVFT